MDFFSFFSEKSLTRASRGIELSSVKYRKKTNTIRLEAHDDKTAEIFVQFLASSL
jgi:hypothetical protein